MKKRSIIVRVLPIIGCLLLIVGSHSFVQAQQVENDPIDTQEVDPESGPLVDYGKTKANIQFEGTETTETTDSSSTEPTLPSEEDDKKPGKQYPATGESFSHFMSFIGMLMVLAAGVFSWLIKSEDEEVF